jgi:hypothetical protein
MLANSGPSEASRPTIQIVFRTSVSTSPDCGAVKRLVAVVLMNRTLFAAPQNDRGHDAAPIQPPHHPLTVRKAEPCRHAATPQSNAPPRPDRPTMSGHCACAAAARGTTPAGAGFSIGTTGETAISSKSSAQRRTEPEMLAPRLTGAPKRFLPRTRIPRHLVQSGEVTPASPLHEPEEPARLSILPLRRKPAGRGLSAATASSPDYIQPEHEF